VLDLTINKGFHLYGLPIPDGYIPFSVDIEENKSFKFDSIALPDSKEFSIKAIDEKFQILPNNFRIESSIRIAGRPEMKKHILTFIINFQACDKNSCLIPEKINLTFPLSISRSLN